MENNKKQTMAAVPQAPRMVGAGKLPEAAVVGGHPCRHHRNSGRPCRHRRNHPCCRGSYCCQNFDGESPVYPHETHVKK